MSFEIDYHEVFPVTLFECFDEKTPMHFIFSLKKDYKRIEEIKKILCHCGAKIGFHKKDITVYSIVIADHNEVVEFYGPVFTTDYITDCLQSRKLLDIGKYRQEATSHLVQASVCMQVVFYRRFGWDSVVKEEDRRWIDLNFKVKLFKDDLVNYNGSQKTRLEDESTKRKIREETEILSKETNCNKKNTQMNNKLVHDELNSKTEVKQVKEREPLESTSKTDPPNRNKLEDESTKRKIREETEILSKETFCNKKNTRMNNKLVHNELNSKTEVKQVEEREPLESTSKTHSPNRNKHKDGSTNRKITEDNNLVSRESDSNEKVNTRLNKKLMDDQSESRKKVSQVIKKESSEWISKKHSPIAGRSKLPLQLLDVGGSSSEDEAKQKSNVSFKRTRLPYTREEQCNILNYIVKHNEYSRIKGREMWMIMEYRDICPKRTWQSMKEHFIKKILINLDNYDCLSEEQKKKIMRAYY